jgi:hypothetical protein
VWHEQSCRESSQESDRNSKQAADMSITNGTSKYSVPDQAKLVFENGILNNPLIAKDLPKDAKELGDKITFNGNQAPSVPVNWRFAESVSALKGLEAVMILSLLRKKYDTEVKEVAINTYVIQMGMIWVITDDETQRSR